jgi:hypothetical protein
MPPSHHADPLRADAIDLPGGDFVAAGLVDLARGAATIPALLVSIGAPPCARPGSVPARDGGGVRTRFT